MSSFLFVHNACVRLNLCSKETLYQDESVIFINSLSADDALEQLRSISAISKPIRVALYAQEEDFLLDTEATIEFCRLLHSEPSLSSLHSSVFPVVPCDYSACMAIALLGFNIEMRLTHPLFEEGITRVKIAHYIIQMIQQHTKNHVMVGGIFSSKEIDLLVQWDVHAIMQYEVGQR